MLESLHERHAPGGREELESIQRYLRQLLTTQDFKGTMMTLRRWKPAKQRTQSLGLPDQAPNEGVAALDGLMRSLERKHQQLGMRIDILRMQPDVVIPTSAGLERYVSLLEAECRRLAADQEIRDARAAQRLKAARSWWLQRWRKRRRVGYASFIINLVGVGRAHRVLLYLRVAREKAKAKVRIRVHQREVGRRPRVPNRTPLNPPSRQRPRNLSQKPSRSPKKSQRPPQSDSSCVIGPCEGYGCSGSGVVKRSLKSLLLCSICLIPKKSLLCWLWAEWSR